MSEQNEISDDQKQAILDAATTVFAEKGYAKASVRQIAAAAGVTTGALYYYYKDKADLLVDVMNQHIHYVHSLYEKDADGTPKPAEVLLKDINEATDERLNNAEWQRLQVMLASEVISGDDDDIRKHRESYGETIRRTADLFGPALGVPEDDRRYFIASFLIAALDGLALQTSLGVHGDEMDTMAAVFNDFFAQSIRTYLDGEDSPKA
jgi:AcrR family transcriptional regulator